MESEKTEKNWMQLYANSTHFINRQEESVQVMNETLQEAVVVDSKIKAH